MAETGEVANQPQPTPLIAGKNSSNNNSSGSVSNLVSMFTKTIATEDSKRPKPKPKPKPDRRAAGRFPQVADNLLGPQPVLHAMKPTDAGGGRGDKGEGNQTNTNPSPRHNTNPIPPKGGKKDFPPRKRKSGGGSDLNSAKGSRQMQAASIDHTAIGIARPGLNFQRPVSYSIDSSPTNQKRNRPVPPPRLPSPRPGSPAEEEPPIPTRDRSGHVVIEPPANFNRPPPSSTSPSQSSNNNDTSSGRRSDPPSHTGTPEQNQQSGLNTSSPPSIVPSPPIVKKKTVQGTMTNSSDVLPTTPPPLTLPTKPPPLTITKPSTDNMDTPSLSPSSSASSSPSSSSSSKHTKGGKKKPDTVFSASTAGLPSSLKEEKKRKKRKEKKGGSMLVDERSPRVSADLDPTQGGGLTERRSTDGGGEENTKLDLDGISKKHKKSKHKKDHKKPPKSPSRGSSNGSESGGTNKTSPPSSTTPSKINNKSSANAAPVSSPGQTGEKSVQIEQAFLAWAGGDSSSPPPPKKGSNVARSPSMSFNSPAGGSLGRSTRQEKKKLFPFVSSDPKSKHKAVESAVSDWLGTDVKKVEKKKKSLMPSKKGGGAAHIPRSVSVSTHMSGAGFPGDHWSEKVKPKEATKRQVSKRPRRIAERPQGAPDYYCSTRLPSMRLPLITTGAPGD